MSSAKDALIAVDIIRQTAEYQLNCLNRQTIYIIHSYLNNDEKISSNSDELWSIKNKILKLDQILGQEHLNVQCDFTVQHVKNSWKLLKLFTKETLQKITQLSPMSDGNFNVQILVLAKYCDLDMSPYECYNIDTALSCFNMDKIKNYLSPTVKQFVRERLANVDVGKMTMNDCIDMWQDMCKCSSYVGPDEIDVHQINIEFSSKWKNKITKCVNFIDSLLTSDMFE
ncbi:hypothetical protein [Orgyia leucostigma nucleopolyhedrovirus]|uniref:Uncharacterized protein n=1 Tax=Orgyia leucostigma nucleopolyhedrovirus TaxID=490711 RepID=B0FE02_9ABAC|nr:hypothetical protein [Orgyia leucostigma nucleopolyhedrovirus]ABY65860.1 hypothetical protein [Orgyia leucostigma nucleopolyhedrovirus]